MAPQETNGIECRICNSNTTNGLIRSPCHCKGSMDCVHIKCLEKWLNASAKSFCELCSYKFEVRRVRKYTFWQSIRAWMHVHHNLHSMRKLLSNMLCSIVFTALLCWATYKWFVTIDDALSPSEPPKDGQQPTNNRQWLVLYSFLIFLCAIFTKAFCVRLYRIVQMKYRCWSRFWNETVVIQLVLDPEDYKIISEEEVNNTPLDSVEDRQNAEDTAEDIKNTQSQEDNGCRKNISDDLPVVPDLRRIED